MSSITGQAAEPGLAAYGATKAALTLFCETITSEEGTNGVLETAIAPGYVDTDMAAWVHESIPPDQMMKTSDIAELTHPPVPLGGGASHRHDQARPEPAPRLTSRPTARHFP